MNISKMVGRIWHYYCTIKRTVLVNIDKMFKIYFIALNVSRMIQLQFATNRIKIHSLEPDVQPSKYVRRLFAGPMASREVMSLPPVRISLVTLYNCFLTVEDYTKETQEISGTKLPYRHCESMMFVLHSSTRDAGRLCNYLLSCKIAFFSFESFHRSHF